MTTLFRQSLQYSKEKLKVQKHINPFSFDSVFHGAKKWEGSEVWVINYFYNIFTTKIIVNFEILYILLLYYIVL